MCALLPRIPTEQKEEQDRSDLAWWWMSSLLCFSKVQFIHKEWSSLNMGREEIAFSCSPRWGSKWKVIWECLPTEVMNNVQIRGRGLSVCSCVAFPILTTRNCFLPLLHSSFLLSFLLKLSSFLPFFLYLLSGLLPAPRAAAGLCGLAGWAVRGRDDKGSICRLWDRTLRQHSLELEHSMPYESRVHAESRRSVTLSTEKRKKIYKSTVWSWASKASAFTFVCAHRHMVLSSKWVKQITSWLIVRAGYCYEPLKIRFCIQRKVLYNVK